MHLVLCLLIMSIAYILVVVSESFLESIIVNFPHDDAMTQNKSIPTSLIGWYAMFF